MEVKTMKKKIIAVMAAVLLLGISSVAYAAPATYCPTGTQVRMDLSNLIETLQNCGSNTGLILKDFNFGNAAKAYQSGITGKDAREDVIVSDNAVSENTDAATGITNNSVSSAKNALEALGSQASCDYKVVDSVISGSGRTSSRLNTAINELLQKLIANSNCFNTVKPTPTPVVTTTPVPTDKPVETPVATAKPTSEPTATLAPSAKPTATPVITQTPAATAKPTAVPTAAPTAKPTAAPTAVPTAKPTVKPTIPQGSDNLAFEKRVVELVNEQRALNGLAPLTLSSKLSDVARAKSQDMHDNRYFSHTSPTYGSPFDMMKAFGISYRTAGENIAMGYSSPESVMDGWMNSPGHRANILNAGYTTIGVGYVADGNYWTQHFTG